MSEEVSDIDEIEQEDGAPSWMVTYADLMTLLLVFFILLFAMSEVEVGKFKAVSVSITDALTSQGLSVLEGTDAPIPNESTNITPPAPIPMPAQASGFLDDIKQLITRKQLDYVVVYQEGDKIVIRIEGKALFRSGDVHIQASAKGALREIYGLFKAYPDYLINIKGHTDNIPIKSVRFPSNWELSAVRATTILRYFIDRGIDPKRLTATGYADLVPITDNKNANNRALNRRVEFVLEKN